METFCLTTIYRYLSGSLNKRHLLLFLFFHTFYLNQNTKKLKSKAKLSNGTIASNSKPTNGGQDEEMNIILDDTRLFKLCFQSTRLNEQQYLYQSDFTTLNSQPNFISLNSWVNFSKLEKQVPFVYQELTRSLRENSNKWIEYFRINKTDNLLVDLTEKDIDLLNDCPLGAELNLFEKLILWLCIYPDKVNSRLFKKS